MASGPFAQLSSVRASPQFLSGDHRTSPFNKDSKGQIGSLWKAVHHGDVRKAFYGRSIGQILPFPFLLSSKSLLSQFSESAPDTDNRSLGFQVRKRCWNEFDFCPTKWALALSLERFSVCWSSHVICEHECLSLLSMPSNQSNSVTVAPLVRVAVGTCYWADCAWAHTDWTVFDNRENICAVHHLSERGRL